MIQQNVSLKEHSSFKIGGPAKYYLNVSSPEEIINGLKEWKELSKDFPEDNKRIFVLGGGTNLLVSDSGFPGFVIRINIKFIERVGDIVRVGAGVSMEDFLDFCVKNSLAGLQWAGGLPGSVGGAVRGNAGAFGGETKDSVYEVTSLDTQTYEIKTRQNEQCKFDYRDGIFKSGEGMDEIVISASFSLKPGDQEEIKKIVEEKRSYRQTKHPLHLPNAGSVFKNVDVKDVPSSVLRELESHIKSDPFPVMPVATLLSVANLKGKRIGGAEVSFDHPNFIVNVDNAKSSDVKDLIEIEKEVIKEKFGIDLEVEVMFVE